MRLAPAVLALALFAAGCAPGGPEPLPPEASASVVQIGQVGNWYGLFVAARGRPPKSSDELAQYAETLSLEARGCERDQIPHVLVSPRDKQPFVIRGSLRLPPRPRGSADAVGLAENGPVSVHERDGAGGKRFVVYYLSGRFELVDDDKFRALVGDPAAPGP